MTGPAVCPVCLKPRYQKHAETCSGPRQIIARPPARERECDCPAGAYHLPDCAHVTGDAA